jgi:hypothetical protein
MTPTPSLSELCAQKRIPMSALNKRESELHWYYRADTPVDLSYPERYYIRNVLPFVRTGTVDNSIHVRNKQSLSPLKWSEWPSCVSTGRRAWPSSPTFNEYLEMVRRGVSPSTQTAGGSKIRSSRQQVRDSPELAIAIAARQVVGLRSDVEIPGKYHGYFRYRQNFAILTGHYSMPIGLARFLLSQWVLCPSNLWLEERVTLKQYLRRVPATLIERSKEYEFSDSELGSETEG